MAQVSVIVTVKNEEDSILHLLHSLESQSLKPHEVIIIDGGSTDRTVKVVESFISSRPSFKLIVTNGVNRSKGRNIGISSSSEEIVACTDAGVALDEHWLENLVKPLVNDYADFVGGVYVQSGESLLQKCIGILQYPNPRKLQADDFLPSSRSVAFKKSVWKTVGGYPEYLEKAEDTYFDLTVQRKGFRIALAKDAVVSWPARKSLKELFLQYSSYAEWDVRAKLFWKLRIYRFMILAYAFLVFSVFSTVTFGFWGFMFPFLIVLTYLILAGAKAFGKTKKVWAFFLAIAIKITIFSAETFGLVKGIVKRLKS